MVSALTPLAGCRGFDPRPRHIKGVIKMVPDASLLSAQHNYMEISGFSLSSRLYNSLYEFQGHVMLRRLTRTYTEVKLIIFQFNSQFTPSKNFTVQTSCAEKDFPCHQTDEICF